MFIAIVLGVFTPVQWVQTSVRITIVIGIARIRSADAPAHTLSLAIRSKAEPLSRQCMSELNSLVRGRRGSEDVVEELLRIQLRLPLAIPLHIVCVARTRAKPDLDTNPSRLAKQTIVHADKAVINYNLDCSLTPTDNSGMIAVAKPDIAARRSR